MSPDVRELTIYAPSRAEATVLAGDRERIEGHVRTDLDARQDEVLKLLDELNERIEDVIREYLPAGAEHGAGVAGQPASASQGHRSGAA